MTTAKLRIALFSGNYNITTDGANRALNRLVEYLLRQGHQVRVYSPTVDEPAFAPQGELVSVPSFAIPGRAEYRFPMGLNAEVREDLGKFAPDVVHVSSPDLSARAAVRWAREHGVPVLASVHTRFETYPRYYKLGFLEGPLEAWLREFYQRCDALVTPSPSMIDTLRAQDMNDDISLWSRGVDREVFNPSRRDGDWRRALGIAEGDVAVGFLGRLVMEKGLDVFSDTIAVLRNRGVAHRVLVVGDGPAREWFAERLPGACFVGFQNGSDLGRAVASMDVLFNPSVTETFGNVTLEAMACGVPVVAAKATGSQSLVADGINGALAAPGDTEAFADALERYCADPVMRRAHGDAGAAKARAFEWDAINQAVADAYARLVARKSAP
ncbi:glycosyltransferase family 4 protein [Altererythrobacter sp. CAU 1778]